MARKKSKVDMTATKAQVLEDERDDLSSVESEQPKKDELDPLVQWVIGRLDAWRQHRDSNHEQKWDEYERLWRGIWSTNEKQRKSERSRIVTPALSEAVENIVAEVEEAVFGRGDFFDIKGEKDDPAELKKITDKNKANLKEDLDRTHYVPNIGEALINGAVYGTGIGEILVKTETVREILPIVGEDGQLDADVEEKDVTTSVFRSVNPRNFIPDPNGKDIESMMGCAVEEYVPAHEIRDGIAREEYRDVDFETDSGDERLRADRLEDTEFSEDKTHVFRYYGLVPKKLLFPPERTEELFPDDAIGNTTEEMVEACVVIANKGVALKALETPYLMKDRPIVAYPWDVVPGRFWGRGVCEKGNVPQKMLDAEFRSRMDAMAFAAAPMVGLDAGRLPRGFKMEVYPGRSILVNGDPNTAMKEFRFGDVNQSTWQQGQALDQMVQRATGSLDVISMAGKGGDPRPGAVSMMLSGIVKRHKRTLMNFVDRMMMPSLRKMMWRNMQYNPVRYIPFNWTFVASSVMGIMQREYETQNLTALLNTMQPQSKEYKILLMGVIANSGIGNRQALIDILKQSIEQELQLQQQQVQMGQMQQQGGQGELMQLEIQLKVAETRAKIADFESRARLQDAKAQNELMEPRWKAQEIATKGIYQVAADQQRAEFDRRMKVADTILKQKDIESNERIAAMQSRASVEAENIKARGQVVSAAANAQTPPPVSPTSVADVAVAAAGAQTAAHNARAESARTEKARVAAASRMLAGGRAKVVPRQDYPY